MRSCRRWQLLMCSWINEELYTSACSDGFAIDVEANHPRKRQLYLIWGRISGFTGALLLEQALLLDVPFPLFYGLAFIVLLFALRQSYF